MASIYAAISTSNDDNSNNGAANSDHGWQKVTYAKRQRKNAAPKQQPDALKSAASGANVFRSVEEHSEERRRRAVEARIAASASDRPIRSNEGGDDEEEEEGSDYETRKGKENGEVVKKVKVKKEKKPKVSVAEAAAKIDAADLFAFLVDATASFENQDDMQLKRLADYFGRAFAGVNSSQFPWVKMFRESPVSKIVDTPVSYISEAVYKTAVDWINKRNVEALSSFVLWSLDSILADFATHQPTPRGSKKAVQQPSNKSQVAIFVVLAMVLRRKPDVLVSILPTQRENSKYQGQDKLPLSIWMIAQACQGDLTVGLYAWAHNLLPIVGAKSTCNPQSRDLILQLVERIVSAPKARTILINGAVRKGERLIPPSSFDVLMRVTFPQASARFKATERFEAVYPILKEVALAGVPGSKAMKQVSQQIFSYSIKALAEGIPGLSKEAGEISVWCLTQHGDCYKQWEKMYDENLEASVAILKKLSVEWKQYATKHVSLDPLRETLLHFKLKNENGLSNEEDTSRIPLFKDAEKYCRTLLGRVSSSHGCMKGLGIVLIVLGLAIIFAPLDIESWDWSKLPETVASWDWNKLPETVKSWDWNKLPEKVKSWDWKELSETVKSWDWNKLPEKVKSSLSY
uniref:Transmembrane protein n=1 Tax=Kalanchoe fedtschenkoi TaxID=63787 RepID=A0A7N0USR2_KALFE